MESEAVFLGKLLVTFRALEVPHPLVDGPHVLGEGGLVGELPVALRALESLVMDCSKVLVPLEGPFEHFATLFTLVAFFRVNSC